MLIQIVKLKIISLNYSEIKASRFIKYVEILLLFHI